MKYIILITVALCAAMVSAAPSSSDCGGALPGAICGHLQTLEKITTNLAKNSINMVARSVEQAAANHARLFSRILSLVNATRQRQSMNATQLAKMLQDLMEMMKEAENARDEALDNARKAIEEASMEIVNLVQKVISDAANGSRTDLLKLQRALRAAMNSAHMKIRTVTYNAIVKVQQANAKVEQYVVKILAKLGNSRASLALSFADSMSMEENMKIADAGEQEIEAEFDEAAKEGYELIVLSNNQGVKRGFSDWWNTIKAKLTALKDAVVRVVKAAVAAMWPILKQKLLEIVQVLVNTARQAIVYISGEIFLVTVPPSLR